MDSLLWIDKKFQRIIERLIRKAIKRIDREIFLEIPPDCVMMPLTDRKNTNQDPSTPF